MIQKHTYTEADWDALVERYFEVETTEAEEAALRRFLCTTQGSAPRYDEVRAVMGFLAVGRSQQAPAVPQKKGRSIRLQTLGRIAAAVIVAMGVGLAAWHTQSQPTEVCIAYVDGREITDREAVIALMTGTMQEVLAEDPTAEMEAQMSEMFSVMDE